MRAVLLTLLLLCTPAQAFDASRPVSGVADIESRFREAVSRDGDVLFIRDTDANAVYAAPASAPWLVSCSDVGGLKITFGANGPSVTIAFDDFTEAECRLYSKAIAALMRP